MVQNFPGIIIFQASAVLGFIFLSNDDIMIEKAKPILTWPKTCWATSFCPLELYVKSFMSIAWRIWRCVLYWKAVWKEVISSHQFQSTLIFLSLIDELNKFEQYTSVPSCLIANQPIKGYLQKKTKFQPNYMRNKLCLNVKKGFWEDWLWIL